MVKQTLLSAMATLLIALPTNAAKPNIVYILADDMGYGDVSACNADSKIPTPNIDRLGHEGIRFIDAHTNSSVCTPTRYGILTGRYCWRTEKKSGVLHGHSDHLIDPNRETVASFLKTRGYATACIGKWHLGMDWTSRDGQKVNESSGKNVDFQKPITNGPLDVGFDYYFGISASLNHPPHAYVENRKVLGALEKLDVVDNTIVVFTSDNGPSPQAKLDHLQSLGHFASGGFRGLKGSLWEAGHRVPFLVRWPAAVKAGEVSERVICTTDLLATVADLHGAELPDDAGEDSVSFLPALKGKTIPGNAARGVVHHSDSGLFAIRRGNWKVVFDKAGGTRRNNPKDPPVKNPADVQLFDMGNDRVESTNVQEQRPEIVKELAVLLDEYITEGRSTPGAVQENEPGKRWSQIDVIRNYIPEDRSRE
jgi:arylsulfatase A-like enzyme